MGLMKIKSVMGQWFVKCRPTSVQIPLYCIVMFKVPRNFKKKRLAAQKRVPRPRVLQTLGAEGPLLSRVTRQFVIRKKKRH